MNFFCERFTSLAKSRAQALGIASDEFKNQRVRPLVRISCSRVYLRGGVGDIKRLRRGSAGASKLLTSRPPPLFVSTDSSRYTMSTPIIIGVGAVAAAFAGRSLMRRGLLGGKNAAEQWVKGGFKAKMDRKEAIAILGLKCVHSRMY